MTCGFLTLGIWVMSGLTITLLRRLFHIIPDDLAHLFALAVMALTPTIWIWKNHTLEETLLQITLKIILGEFGWGLKLIKQILVKSFSDLTT